MQQEVRRLVFITGASSGIGQALALRYYQAGYALALVARRTAQMQAWVAACAISIERCRIYSVDVSVVDEIVAAGHACIAQQGVPDVVIASAGISIGVDTACRADLDVMAKIFALNNVGLAGTFHPFIASMVQRGFGTLVGVASVNGIRGFPGHGAYCASKAGVISYCESLRGELAPKGVRVLTICPGYVDTPLTRKNRNSMPFLLPATGFAERAFKAIAANRSYSVIPWQMAVVAKALRLMPNWLFDKVASRRPRKPRSADL